MAVKHTSSIAISKLLEDNASKTQFFAIPKYQREYTWGKKEWTALFNDVLENGKDYFLGSIISVCDDSISQDYPVLEIIDGQQRMTTLSILLAVLYKKASFFEDDLRNSKDDRYHQLWSLMKQLVYKKKNAKGTELATPRLEPQKENSKDFNYVLYKCGLLENIDAPKNFGNRKISKAYNFFIEQIDSLAEEKKVGFFDECSFLFDLIEKFNSAILVDIEVSNNKDAYMLFESLNHRGVPLSAIDLIKNSLIKVSAGKGDDLDCYNTWQQSILPRLTEEYGVQERFFRQFYNAFRDELNTPFKKLISNAKTKYYLGPLATKTTLLDIYENLIKNDYASLLRQLKEKADIYSFIINNNEECPEILRKPFLDLERIQGTPSYILLLYVLSKKKELNLNDSRIKKIIVLLIKFFVRRNVTDYPNTRNLTKIFMECVELISSKKNDDVYNAIHEKLVGESSSNDTFKMKLGGKIYEENVDAARFLLSCYEESFFTKENEVDLWKRDIKNKYVFTIEHIFPEGDKIPQHWIDMIASGSADLAEKYKEDYVHTIGNLTLTGFNSTLSNKAFDEKKNLKDKDGKYIGYRNGFKLNNDVVQENEWTVEKITARTKNLVKFYLKKFAL